MWFLLSITASTIGIFFSTLFCVCGASEPQTAFEGQVEDCGNWFSSLNHVGPKGQTQILDLEACQCHLVGPRLSFDWLVLKALSHKGVSDYFCILLTEQNPI